MDVLGDFAMLLEVLFEECSCGIGRIKRGLRPILRALALLSILIAILDAWTTSQASGMLLFDEARTRTYGKAAFVLWKVGWLLFNFLRSYRQALIVAAVAECAMGPFLSLLSGETFDLFESYEFAESDADEPPPLEVDRPTRRPPPPCEQIDCCLPPEWKGVALDYDPCVGVVPAEVKAVWDRSAASGRVRFEGVRKRKR